MPRDGDGGNRWQYEGCPDHVSDELPSNILRNVDGGEAGKLKVVSGDEDNPDSQGFLCVRGRSTNEIFGIRADCCTSRFVMIK